MPRYPQKSLLPCQAAAAQETQIQNLPLSPVWRSNSCPDRRSRVSRRSGNAKPREERVEISAIQGVAPPEACRRLSLEIDFSGAISALSVDQGYLGCPLAETQIRARKTSAFTKISAIQGVALVEQRSRPTLKIGLSGLCC